MLVYNLAAVALLTYLRFVEGMNGLGLLPARHWCTRGLRLSIACPRSASLQGMRRPSSLRISC
ncbi:MAG: hypothetical protein IPH90_07380 [Thermomonas sp.]|nr:hypothetical protein [Thermomonas sp.]